MPILPHNRNRYPPSWPEIRAAIRERAGGRCEGSPVFPGCRAVNGELHPVTGSMVVLTCAHLNHQPEDCAPTNLRMLCQRCHLSLDASRHQENRRLRRGERHRWGKMLSLPLEDAAG